MDEDFEPNTRFKHRRLKDIPLLKRIEIDVNLTKSEIEKIEPYQSDPIRTLIFIVLGILSGGILFVVSFWYPRVAIKILRKPAITAEATHFSIKGQTGQWETVTVKKAQQTDANAPTLRYFIFHQQRYIWDESCKTYIKHELDVRQPFKTICETMTTGLYDNEARDKRLLYGSNVIQIPVPSIPRMVVNEALHPFYFFQVFSCILWLAQDYTTFSICIMVLSLISLAWTVSYARYNLVKLQKMARHESQVNAFRLRVGNVPTKLAMSSVDLVPGDILEITAGMEIPCDVILLSGEVIVNESMLTGESIPVLKQAIKATSDKNYSPDHHKKHTLFCGTKVIQIKPTGSVPLVKGLVFRTGYDTAKGHLVRSILFPKPVKFKFYRDSYYFLFGMTVIALIAFMYNVTIFIQRGTKFVRLIIKCLDLVTIAVPPALPLVLTIGVGFAVNRLKRSRIFCISPPRIHFAGKIDTICFDKTGTLTTDTLEVYGVQGVDANRRFSPVRMSNFSLPTTEDGTPPLDPQLIQVLASCHGLSLINGKTLSGHPVDLKMFECTGWRYNDSDRSSGTEHILATVSPPQASNEQHNLNNNPVALLHRFDFESKLQRMSVLIKDLVTGEVSLSTKGSPEAIRPLCLPDTVPRKFDQILHEYTHKGYYVLACATRSFDTEQVQPREVMETNLRFLGFLILSNKLKPDSKATIEALQKAKIRSIIITGDSPITAVCVAREVNIIPSDAKVLLADVFDDRVLWTDVDSAKTVACEQKTLVQQESVGSPVDWDEISLDQSGSAVNLNFTTYGGNAVSMGSKAVDGSTKSKFVLAVTGKALELLSSSPKFNEILKHTYVWARVTPDQKTQLIEGLIDQGHYVAMCGDGTNDCGALKAAHVGLALSDAEASIVAPFTSKAKKVSCMERLLREGRCAQVTSFAAFSYMALYPMIQLMATIRARSVGSNLSNNQYLFEDMAIVLPLATTMSLTGAYKLLTEQRPTQNLLGPLVLSSVIGQTLIQIVFLIIANVLLQFQPWFCPLSLHPPATCPINPLNVNADTFFNYENTVTFVVSNFQYIIVALAFSSSKPFRKPFYTNILYTLSLIVTTLACAYLLLYPSGPTLRMFQMVEIPTLSFRLVLLGVVAANFAVSLLWEWVFVAGPVAFLIEKHISPKIKQKTDAFMGLFSKGTQAGSAAGAGATTSATGGVVQLTTTATVGVHEDDIIPLDQAAAVLAPTSAGISNTGKPAAAGSSSSMNTGISENYAELEDIRID